MRLLIGLAAVSAVISGACAGIARADDPETVAQATPPAVGGVMREIFIGSGPVSGAYFVVAGAVCHSVALSQPDTRCFVENNANSSANIKKMSSGLLDFAVVQSDWLMHAARGTNLFNAAGPDESLRAVMALHAEPLTLIARRGAAIAEPAALKGKRIGIGPTFTYQRLLMETVLKAWDLDNDDMALVLEGTAMEQFSALCAGEIDAAAIVVAHPSPVLAEAMQRCDLKLVPVEGDELEDILEARPELSAARIPAGLYAKVADDVMSFGLRAILATSINVDDALVREVTEAILKSLPDFTRQHPVLSGLGTDEMITAGIAVPLHRGAEAAYRAKGLLSGE